MSINKAAGGRKNRKWGRNKLFCEAYRRENRREKNKVIYLTKHISRHPNDTVGLAALEKYRGISR